MLCVWLIVVSHVVGYNDADRQFIRVTVLHITFTCNYRKFPMQLLSVVYNMHTCATCQHLRLRIHSRRHVIT